MWRRELGWTSVFVPYADKDAEHVYDRLRRKKIGAVTLNQRDSVWDDIQSFSISGRVLIPDDEAENAFAQLAEHFYGGLYSGFIEELPPETSDET